MAEQRTPTHLDSLRRIGALSQRIHAALAVAVELNGTSLDAMEWLGREGPLTARELAARLNITPGAVTGVIDRLVATGHASRVPHAGDGRSIQVVPNPDSFRSVAGLLGPMIAELQRRGQDYTPDDYEVIERFLADVEAAYLIGVESLTTAPSTTPV
ncbi:MarR family winged helix-turn-helix transcriptional regulator [Pseudolysinimonas sp.]|jgi:DNA-binding MarR family transcriptional regulator|uniref:MarR family winged helix-turn-helix transcriptional regulator n=1 Tax=Pseudolysinimonas sp. TaxID=2680009 RepID=UPI003784B6F3